MVKRSQVVEFHAGTRHIIRDTVVDSAGAVYPLTNSEIIKFNLARIANGAPLKASPLLDFRSDVSSQLTITTPASGIIEMELLPADTESIQPGTYWFQFEVYTSLNTLPVMVSEGTLTLWTNVDNV